MKKAYMIFAYSDALKVKRLVEALDYNCDFFIHVDKKADEEVFKANLKNISHCFFVKKRYRVAWGGWSQVQAIMEMLSAAVNSNGEYSHIILITETDYPIKSNKEIEEYLSNHLNTEFVMGLDCAEHGKVEKINRAWWFDYPITNQKVWRMTCRVINHTVLPFFRKRKFCFLKGKKVHPFFGQMLFAVTPKCARTIIDVYVNDKQFNNYMKTVYVPCEFYYQTIIFNSKFRGNTCELGQEHEDTPDFSWAPLHHYNYSTIIKVYKENDFEELIKSEKLFFRKAIRGESDELMNMIDEERQIN